MEDNKKIPENNEASIEESKAGAKKPLPKSMLIVGAISTVVVIGLVIALILALGSKKPDGGSGGNDNENHSFGEWTLYNEGETDCAKKIYRRTCSDCSTLEWKEGKYEDHVWGTEYISDASQHWKKCKNCAVLTAKEDHTEGDEGICTLCDAPLGDTAGIVYDVSADGTYAEVVGYDGTAKKIKIASEYNGLPVKTIYSEAFMRNKTITSVIIPDSVTSIGYRAFYDCNSLESVVIPDSVTSIGSYAFYGCSKLTSVVIPDSVKGIGSTAFSRCDSLVSVVIPDSVTSIGEYAFYSCSSLASVVIPDSVTSIGDDAFKNCSSALYTEYEYGKYVKSGDNPYAVLIEVTKKNLSTYTIHEDTKVIAYGAFSSCSRLTSITIPDGVRGINDYAFSNCSSLASVVIPDGVTSIGEYAFGYCSSLASVVIPDSVTSIGSSAFFWCDSLRDVYYTGTEEEWGQISIGANNWDLTDATIHYNYVPEE